MTENQEFFLAECCVHARRLSVPDAVKFLRGLAATCGEDPAVDSVRTILIALSESDRQLELIQTRQMKLEFSASNADEGKGTP
jgi:hypothetical protein